MGYPHATTRRRRHSPRQHELGEREVMGFADGEMGNVDYLDELIGELDAIDEASPAFDHEVIAEWERGRPARGEHA